MGNTLFIVAVKLVRGNSRTSSITHTHENTLRILVYNIRRLADAPLAIPPPTNLDRQTQQTSGPWQWPRSTRSPPDQWRTCSPAARDAASGTHCTAAFAARDRAPDPASTSTSRIAGVIIVALGKSVVVCSHFSFHLLSARSPHCRQIARSSNRWMSHAQLTGVSRVLLYNLALAAGENSPGVSTRTKNPDTKCKLARGAKVVRDVHARDDPAKLTCRCSSDCVCVLQRAPVGRRIGYFDYVQ